MVASSPGRSQQRQGRRDPLIAVQSCQFLNQVRLAGEIAATRWHNHLDSAIARLPLCLQSERSQELFRLLCPYANSQYFFDAGFTQQNSHWFHPPRVTIGHRRQRLTAGQLCKKISRPMEGHECALWIDASFETVRCLTMEPESFCRATNGCWVEIGALHQDGA